MRLAHLALAALVSAETPYKCAWQPAEHPDVIFDLGPLAKQQDVVFQSSPSLFEGFEPFMGLTRSREQRIAVSVCGDTRGSGDAACRGEHAPGVLTEREPAQMGGLPPGHPLASDPLLASLFGASLERPPAQAARPPRCAVLGRRGDGPKYALLDPADPSEGLQLLYEKGDSCGDTGRRASLLFLLHCDLAAQGLRGQLSAQVQTRDQCRWTISIATAAACPVNAGPRTTCAPNCPRTWLGDGECDAGCDTRACGFDGGDCTRRTRAPPEAAAATCAPGCQRAWLGDHECDEECNTAACRWDGGDCTGVCAPGCADKWLHDGECDDECNTGTCGWDGGDCLRNGRPVACARCAWGCPSAWLGDGQCDICLLYTSPSPRDS